MVMKATSGSFDAARERRENLNKRWQKIQESAEEFKLEKVWPEKYSDLITNANPNHGFNARPLLEVAFHSANASYNKLAMSAVQMSNGAELDKIESLVLQAEIDQKVYLKQLAHSIFENKAGIRALLLGEIGRLTTSVLSNELINASDDLHKKYHSIDKEEIKLSEQRTASWKTQPDDHDSQARCAVRLLSLEKEVFELQKKVVSATKEKDLEQIEKLEALIKTLDNNGTKASINQSEIEKLKKISAESRASVNNPNNTLRDLKRINNEVSGHILNIMKKLANEKASDPAITAAEDTIREMNTLFDKELKDHRFKAPTLTSERTLLHLSLSTYKTRVKGAIDTDSIQKAATELTSATTRAAEIIKKTRADFEKHYHDVLLPEKKEVLMKQRKAVTLESTDRDLVKNEVH